MKFGCRVILVESFRVVSSRHPQAACASMVSPTVIVVRLAPERTDVTRDDHQHGRHGAGDHGGIMAGKLGGTLLSRSDAW
jgi:hypothetical protein